MSGVSPEATVDQIRLHETPPKPSYALNRKRIGAVIALLVIIVGWVFFSSLSMPEKSDGTEQKPKHSSPLPGEAVQSLPNDYASLARARPKLTSIPKTEAGSKPAARSLSAEEEFLRETKMRRLKSIYAAREADVSFKGLTVDDTQRRGGSQGGAVGSGDRDAPGVEAASFGSSRDDDNRQDDKLSFLKTKATESEVLPHGVRSRVSKYQVSAGTVISGIMITGLNSDLPGQILGQVSQDIFDSPDGRYRLIPQGTRVIGQYDSRVVYGQDRALIVWTRLVFPNGSSLNLEGMPGVDLSGYAGLADQVNNHYVRLLTGVVLSSLLSASAQMAEGPSYNTEDPRFEQLAVQGAAKEINQVGQQITRKNLNIQPTIEIRPGMRFNVFVNKDLILRPYQD